MNKVDAAIADSIIANSINLFRLTASEQRKAAVIIERMKRDLIAELASNGNLTLLNKRQIKQLISSAEKIILDYYIDLHLGIGETLDDLVDHEIAATTKAFTAIDIGYVLPTQAIIKSLSSDLIIQGSPSKDWWAAQGEGLSFKFAAQVRQAIASGESKLKVIDRILPVIETSKRGAYALVHTSIQTVANNTRLETFRANADVIDGVEQLSTLDGHTSTVCVAYSGGKWNLDGVPIKGTTLAFNGGPPRHWNCRSVLVPILKPLPGFDLPPGTRASDEGQISATITFDKFLEGKTEQYQNELLGKGRAQLWRDGKITLKDLLNQSGRPLTLKQLKAKY